VRRQVVGSRHKGQHGLHGQLLRPNDGNLTEPSAQQRGLKLVFLLNSREVVARQSQRQVAIPSVPKDFGAGAVKGDLWD
jgi:hypothetical protein